LLTVVDDLHVQLRIEILSLIKAKFLWLYLWNYFLRLF
jgi:hypothetical protein